jgi:hypothetical protein
MIALCVTSLLLSSAGFAMPNFSRKYEKNCGLCHTQVPKLNRTGYEFRLAGFRMPDEIGEKQEFNLADLFAARIQMQGFNKQHEDVNPAKDSSTSQLEFFEFTLYPLSGSWGTNFGSLVELSMAPGESFEVENAYVRGVWGNTERGWFTGKVGVMHPWEGFGASDRPLGNIRPLFQKQAAIGSPFYLWNIDEMAIEAGYYYPRTGTNLSARISNGVIWKPDSGGAFSDHADPAQGGDLTKSSNQIGKNHKNWQVVLNQYFNKDSGITVYYYEGEIPFPDIAEPTNPLTGVTTTDKYSRLAIYGNFFVLPKKLNLLAGWSEGDDSLDDPNVTGVLSNSTTPQLGSQVGKSDGVFGEIDYHIIDNKLAVGARYDEFDPSDKVDHNSQDAVTVFANYQALETLQLIGDYQHKTTEAGANPGDNEDNQFLARLIFIF